MAAAVCAILFSGVSARASEPVSGTFKAVRACDAFRSFKNGTNPGAVRLTAGESYDAVEINTPAWAWIRVEVPGVVDPLRWVPRDCGTADITTSGTPSTGGGGAACNLKDEYDSNVLALSWQPGFCEHDPGGPAKPECKAMASGDLVVNHLTLHGLWPNRKQCGTQYGACASTPLSLTDETTAMLTPWMPNFLYATSLGSHEWLKHGTCQSREDDEYFRVAVALVERVNHSAFAGLLTGNTGGQVSITDLLRAIEDEAGAGAGKRVTFVCASGKFLKEIRFSLPRAVDETTGLEALLTGPELPGKQGCSGDLLTIEGSGPG